MGPYFAAHPQYLSTPLLPGWTKPNGVNIAATYPLVLADAFFSSSSLLVSSNPDLRLVLSISSLGSIISSDLPMMMLNRNTNINWEKMDKNDKYKDIEMLNFWSQYNHFPTCNFQIDKYKKLDEGSATFSNDGFWFSKAKTLEKFQKWGVLVFQMSCKWCPNEMQQCLSCTLVIKKAVINEVYADPTAHRHGRKVQHVEQCLSS